MHECWETLRRSALLACLHQTVRKRGTWLKNIILRNVQMFQTPGDDESFEILSWTCSVLSNLRQICVEFWEEPKVTGNCGQMSCLAVFCEKFAPIDVHICLHVACSSLTQVARFFSSDWYTCCINTLSQTTDEQFRFIYKKERIFTHSCASKNPSTFNTTTNFPRQFHIAAAFSINCTSQFDQGAEFRRVLRTIGRSLSLSLSLSLTRHRWTNNEIRHINADNKKHLHEYLREYLRLDLSEVPMLREISKLLEASWKRQKSETLIAIGQSVDA